MSAQDDSAALAEINELVTFVGHSNPQVRLQATAMVTSLSALESNRTLIARTKMIDALKRQLTDVKEIAREVYKSSINFGESDELASQMLSSNFISISMEILRDSATDYELRELILMFLVNMTRDEKGARVLMQEGEEVEGLHVRRLFNWFVQFVPTSSSNASQMDPNAYCAHILTNITQLPSGRRLVMSKDRGFLPALKTQFTSTNPVRRLGVFQLIKNCFMDDDSHAYLLSRDLGIWTLILEPIIGDEPFLHGEAEYEGIRPEIRALMKMGKRRDADPQIRVLIYEIILLCAKYKPSRMQLRGEAIYPILRHAHDQEKSNEECKELDDLLEQLIPFFILDEDDAKHPQKKEEEEKRKRIEQVKSMNEKENSKASSASSSSASASSSSSSSSSKPAVGEDKPVHYLGDELGSVVRSRDTATEEKSEKPKVQASASLPVDKAMLEEDFPAMEPIGAEETAQLGQVEHNIKSLSLIKSESAAAAQKSSQADTAKPVVYAQPEADEDDDIPELADEEEQRYMNGLD